MSTDHTSYLSHASYLAAITLALLLIPAIMLAAQSAPPRLLPEGTVLESVDGRLVRADANDLWLFELSADANSVGGRVTAGMQFELLPCAMLELLIADVNDRLAPTYRLSARATTYRGKNFLLPVYYLPLSKLEGGKPAMQREEAMRPAAEPAIPAEIIEELGSRRAARGPAKPQGPKTQNLASVLVDAIGTIYTDSDGPVFTPNAFGWGIGRTRYRLLPCRVLEQAMQKQATSPDPIRLNVAGLVTKFKGNRYLLLHRTIRSYDYGNFGG